MIKRLIMSIIALAFAGVVFAQDRPSLAIYQDGRLAVFKDDNGNSPYTMDILARAELQGKQFKAYYFSIIAEFEYAELSGGYYRRFGLGAGWTFNKIIERIELTPSITTSIIHRFGNSHRYVFALGGDVSYKLTNHWKLSLFPQLLNREDLRDEFNDSFSESLRVSVFWGIKYQF